MFEVDDGQRDIHDQRMIASVMATPITGVPPGKRSLPQLLLKRQFSSLQFQLTVIHIVLQYFKLKRIHRLTLLNFNKI